MGVSNFIGKLFFASTFIIPFLFMPIFLAIIIDIIWGFILIVFVDIQIALLEGENKFKTITKNLIIAIIILFTSYLIGTAINHFLVT